MVEYFDYMHGDKLTTRVYFDLSKKKIIKFENYSEDLIERFFGVHSLENLCWDDLMLRLENRTFSKYRPDVDIILDYLGINSGFNIWSILPITRGIMSSDNFWIRFEGDDVDYATAYRQTHLYGQPVEVVRG